MSVSTEDKWRGCECIKCAKKVWTVVQTLWMDTQKFVARELRICHFSQSHSLVCTTNVLRLRSGMSQVVINTMTTHKRCAATKQIVIDEDQDERIYLFPKIWKKLDQSTTHNLCHKNLKVMWPWVCSFPLSPGKILPQGPGKGLIDLKAYLSRSLSWAFNMKV